MAKAKHTTEQINGRVLAFKPMVLSTAGKIVRSGMPVEFEDLVQEGYLGLLILIPKCRDWEWLPWYMRKRLPPYMWCAAKRLLGRAEEADFDLLEETVCDPYSQDELEHIELGYMLGKTLTHEEHQIVEARLSGSTQSEIAQKLGTYQATVHERQKRIRRKLAAAMERGEMAA